MNPNCNSNWCDPCPNEILSQHYLPTNCNLELLQVEQALHKTQAELEEYRTLYESLPAIYFTLDLAGVVIRVNQFGAVSLGYTTQQLIGYPVFQVFHPEDRAEIQAELLNFLQHPTEGTQQKFRLVSKDGRILWVKVSGRALQRTTINKNLEILLFCENVAEGKRTEEEITQDPHYLEELVQERTAELMRTNEQLQQEIAERKRAEADRDRQGEEERLAKINQCFLSFGTDPTENINRLTTLCGELLGATCALYSRIEQGMLCSVGQWHTPANFNPVDDPDGHLCWDVIKQEGHELFVVRDLPRTPYAQTDPNVMPYHLQTYIGQTVKCQDAYIGSLCAVFQKDFIPSVADREIVGIIAAAIAVEEARHQSEERLRLVLQNMPVMMDAFDANGNIMIWNRECERVTGYSAQEIVDNPKAMELFYPDSDYRQQMMAAWNERGHNYRDWEWKVTCKDGSVKTISWSNISQQFPIPGWATWGVAVDVTDRKQVEEALRQQFLREQLVAATLKRIHQSLNLEEILETTVTEVRQFLQTDRVLIYRVWPNGTGSAVTEAVVPGWPAILGQTFGQEVFPKQSQQLYSQGRILAIHNVEQAEIPPCLLEFVQQFGVKAKLVVPILQEEKLWGLLIAHHCTSPRQWQPLEIELLKQLATQVAIAIQQSELFGQVQQLNTVLEKQVQERTAQLQQALSFEALLKRITDKVRDSLDESHILQAAVQELALGLKVDCCDTALYDLSCGTLTICYDYTISSIPSALGNVLSMADLPDICPQLLQGRYLHFCEINPDPVRALRKQTTILACPIFDNQGVLGDLWLFNQNGRLFNELEIRLVQQVANQCAIAIRQARLYQAAQKQVEELERLNQLKDDFLNTVSHELRTPMANIKMAMQMLEIVLDWEGNFGRETVSKAELSKAAQYLQILNDECDRESSLINDLLDLQRLDAGNQPLDPTRIYLQDWIPHVAEPFEQRALNQQQILLVDVPVEVPPLFSDTFSLGRILAELLNNACKYTPPEETITVTARTSSGMILLSVSNSGVEIPERELAHVFDKFYRIPSHDPWKQGGTGLGLALVKKLTEHLGGRIWVESAANQICFTVELPTQVEARW